MHNRQCIVLLVTQRFTTNYNVEFINALYLDLNFAKRPRDKFVPVLTHVIAINHFLPGIPLSLSDCSQLVIFSRNLNSSEDFPVLGN